MEGIREIFLLFYKVNKWAMNLYWVLYLWLLVTGKVNLFAHFMALMCFLYFLSNLVHYLPGRM